MSVSENFPTFLRPFMLIYSITGNYLELHFYSLLILIVSVNHLHLTHSYMESRKRAIG